MAERKLDKRLDIFKVLNALDAGDKKFYSRLSEEDRKGFAPSVALRWLSSATGMEAYYLVMTNEANIGFWDFSKHPELQYLLMTVVGTGKIVRHNWIPGTKRGSKITNKVDALLLRRYPNASPDEIALLRKVNSKDDIGELAADFGLTDKEIREIVKDYEKN